MSYKTKPPTGGKPVDGGGNDNGGYPSHCTTPCPFDTTLAGLLAQANERQRRAELAGDMAGAVLLHNQRGTITANQEAALVRLVAAIGLETFRTYRARLGIYAPLLQLSKQQASALIDAVVRDIEAGQ